MIAFSDAQDTHTTPTPCPRCGSPGPHCSGPGAGSHYPRLLCGAFLLWLPKPRPVGPEVRHA
jgi:hypothetical protein